MKKIEKNNILIKLEKAKSEGKGILKVTIEEKKELEKLKNYNVVESYQIDRECKKNEIGTWIGIKIILDK